MTDLHPNYRIPGRAQRLVGTTDLADDSVTAAKIAADAVGSSELANDAVDTNAIANLAVTAAKIANDTITATQVAANAIGSSELADNAVDTAAIADGAVAAVKQAPGVVVTSTVYFDADPAGNTSSDTYVDVSGSSFSFTKKLAATALQFTMHVGCYSTAGNPGAVFGIRINSVDYDGPDFFFNNTSVHHAFSGVREIGGGVVPAGTYTVQNRWHTTGGNQIVMDSGDNVHVLMQEVTV